MHRAGCSRLMTIYDLRWVFSATALASNLRQLASIFCASPRSLLVRAWIVVTRLALHHFIEERSDASSRVISYHELWITWIISFRKSFNIYKSDTNQLKWFELNWVWHTSIERTRPHRSRPPPTPSSRFSWQTLQHDTNDLTASVRRHCFVCGQRSNWRDIKAITPFECEPRSCQRIQSANIYHNYLHMQLKPI